jgi:hypothetical protein
MHPDARAGPEIAELSPLEWWPIMNPRRGKFIGPYPTQAEAFQRIALQYAGSRKVSVTRNEREDAVTTLRN